MYYYRSCSGFLICTGITCIFIGIFIGPTFGGVLYLYLIVGLLMLVIGLISAYFKYKFESTPRIKVREDSSGKKTSYYICPRCKVPVEKEPGICPQCGNKI